MGDPVELSWDDTVATIKLNRPDAANSLSLQVAQDLLEAVRECSAGPARAVLITGVGKVFCTGGDLKEFSAQGERIADHLQRTADAMHAAILSLVQLNAPIIAAVNGVAAGAGMSLACACDLALAAQSARFTMAYTRVGLSPDGSGTWFIPRLIGHRRALELAITNRTLTAAEALDWGLVTRVLADDALATEANSIAHQLADGPTLAYAAARQLMHQGWTNPLSKQLDLETQSIARLGASDDAQEGMHAFIEKRPAKFTGC
ncbi:MAG TPA: enoyl-CoA hydratase-related protein [Chloroflexota bacterium]|jgi:2-(1,2-epoxy-1,2-dihydrophenyl)acetyl-CoA isomerase|nr:enoyl-CoA hydratase-related protein [Chloroflexota bacterium]